MTRQEYYKEWASKNRDKLHAAQKRHRDKVKADSGLHDNYKRKQREYRNTNIGRASRLYFGSLKRANTLGLEHSLDIAWILERIDGGVCEVTGIPFELTEGRNPFSPSLDKTDPSKGYTKANTKVVCWCYNSAKGSWRHEDVLKMAEALVKHEMH